MAKPLITREAWIAALRSGEYKQAAYVMYDSDNESFCCLGVACAVAGIPLETLANVRLSAIAAKRPHQTYEADAPMYAFGSPTDDQTYAPQLTQIVTDLKLTFIDQRKLADMNDTCKSFAEIADYIEKELP